MTLCLAALMAFPARAQIAPATTEELQQQAGQAIQQSTDALRRDMQQNTQNQIQQRQDEQRLFSPVTNPSVAPNVAGPFYQPYSYEPYPPLLPPPSPKKAPPAPSPKEAQD